MFGGISFLNLFPITALSMNEATARSGRRKTSKVSGIG